MDRERERAAVGSGPQRNEASALLHQALLDELTDSLTAVGSWLAVAELKAQRSDTGQNDLAEALLRAVRQHYRASRALRRLRNTQPVDPTQGEGPLNRRESTVHPDAG